MRFNLPALIGGAAGVAGVATAAALAGVMHQRLVISREAGAAHPLGMSPVSRHSRVVTSDGISLYVEEFGPLDAPLTVLFVHGFTLNLHAFQFQREAVERHFGESVRMVFFDLRSHGRSDRSAVKDCTMAQLGADIDRVIKAVRPAGALAVVGHSMGGMSVMAFAERYPEYFRPRPPGTAAEENYRISSVALLNTSAGDLKLLTLGLPSYLARLGTPVLPFVLRRAARSADLVERARLIAKDLAWVLTKRLSFASPDVAPELVAFATDMIAATRVDVVAAFFSTLVSHDGSLGLQSLTACDVLVIGAENDAMIPPQHCVAIATALPESRLIIVGCAGHLLMLERPDSVNEPLLTLLDTAIDRAPLR